MPIEVPDGVEVKVKGSHVRVKGPKGELTHTFPTSMKISFKDGVLTVERPSDERFHRAMHGTTRSILNNMVVGVHKGYHKVLEVEGVGYRAEVSGSDLILNVGYSHPVTIHPPEGITFEVDNRNRQITVRGYDKQAVGEIAAIVRKVRPPEPYKGKGIRYQGEYIRRKAGKSGKKVM
jgi:large subunit ribosomal protein L6